MGKAAEKMRKVVEKILKAVSRKYAIEMQCHECMGRYADGKQDCQNVKCSLYSYMPYAKLEPDLSWTEYNPRKKGMVTWFDSQRDMTDEQKDAVRERFSKKIA